jgi:hypothetical protein
MGMNLRTLSPVDQAALEYFQHVRATNQSELTISGTKVYNMAHAEDPRISYAGVIGQEARQLDRTLKELYLPTKQARLLGRLGVKQSAAVRMRVRPGFGSRIATLPLMLSEPISSEERIVQGHVIDTSESNDYTGCIDMGIFTVAADLDSQDTNEILAYEIHVEDIDTDQPSASVGGAAVIAYKRSRLKDTDPELYELLEVVAPRLARAKDTGTYGVGRKIFEGGKPDEYTLEEKAILRKNSHLLDDIEITWEEQWDPASRRNSHLAESDQEEFALVLGLVMNAHKELRGTKR